MTHTCIYIYIYTDKTTLRVIRRLGGWGRGSSTDDNSCRHSLPPPSPLKPSYHTKGNKTKCMTKSGQGSLVKVMEHSFSLCIEKAREQTQGAGSAIVKWFNLQSLTEVKSQLETMHLLFGVPRFFCSREFSNVYLKSLYLKINVFEIWKYCPARPAENCNFSKRFLIKN